MIRRIWRSGAKQGSTGRPVGLLLQYLLSAQKADAAKPGKADKDARPGKAKVVKADKPGKAAVNQDGSDRPAGN